MLSAFYLFIFPIKEMSCLNIPLVYTIGIRKNMVSECTEKGIMKKNG